MTKEITKAFILQRMTDELALRELVPEKFTFSENVVPVYNMEKHLKNWMIETATKSVTTTGGLLFLKPPDNERWTVNGYTVVFVTGVYTIAGVYIIRNHTESNFVYIDLAPAQTVSYTVNLPKPIELVYGDRFYINIDGYTSTGNLTLNIDVNKEKIR